ncbi:glycoside hydrolase family 97 protein [Streptomyces sp. TS71-3]|uniref:glycoside hydrolase family 97 protein n=1 Tax=Streptomyces sp. TS71-3 TaxID=2733862 RepID=UPI001B1A2A17|nr:glycoside hydrolase family 97 protein [Streptomyces sp. TS71-3]GHJ37805.1 alpha-glucosidase [Streptomyces sp. TS71-3]
MLRSVRHGTRHRTRHRTPHGFVHRVRHGTLAVLVPGLVATALLGTGPARASAPAQPPGQGAGWTVNGPGPADPVARLRLDPAEGTLSLDVTDHGRTVIEPSAVGIVTERADLSKGLRYQGRSDRVVSEHYRAVAGKQSSRQVLMRESRFRFAGAGGARVDLLVRASHDGVAYRYVLPSGSGDVLGETSAFTLPAGAEAWLGAYRQDNENLFKEYRASEAPAGEYMDQALFRTGDAYALIAESDLTGSYSAARLVHDAGSSTYRIGLWDQRVAVSGALSTPWRAMIVGDLATVTESTFTDDLAPASRIADTSWIKPGPALWTWLAGGRTAGQSLTAQEGYVDYAAQRGWPYEVVDAGWYFAPDQWDTTDPNWQQDSWMPQLVDYARQRGVGVLVWVHFRDLDTAEEREQWLSTLEKWGVKGLKIDFMDSESQERMRWYDEILPELAAHHLLVEFHGSTIPKGIQRTWPNVLTMEGVNGEEKKTNTPQHLATLPYTRNVIGSMDYTPGAFQRAERPNAGSDASELGLSVLYESGVQNLAGTPESYDQRPEARSFLEQIPAAWDRTRLLAGKPGESAVLARGSGGRWFIGGTFAGAAHTAKVPLRIDPGPWLVEVIQDGPDGLVRVPHVMHGGQTLTVPVVADGGFAALACRWHPGITTCEKAPS